LNVWRPLVMRHPDVVPRGSNEPAIDEFETRPNFDAHNERHVEAVFASDDPIWPLYFAVVNRPVVRSLINWCEHPGNGTSRYVFSIPVRPRARLTVGPDDFPFRRKTRGHRRGDSVRKVWLKNALRLP
jgi:hypothetical protein